MAITRDEFIESVTQLGLLDAEEVRAFLAALPQDHQPQTAEDLAREMYRLGKLTRFQAVAIYHKKTRGLVAGNYVVLDRLGKGGMGTVYKAQHRRMKRIVALKMLPSSATKSPEAVLRFQREVEAAAKLSHPNIVTAYDADEARGVHFLVMEYVEGQDLHALVKQQGPVPVAQALDYVMQAARGLEYAHSQGVIHRDIKPPNLLLDKNGTLKILDMGLARVEDSVGSPDAVPGEGLTHSGQVMGTLDFMPPEQALDTKSVDLRADIYSLGCTLCYLLTGRPPFGGDTIGKKIVAHREAPIPSLRAVRDDVPESLDAVFQKMLAKRPEQRQASMTEVVSQLRACAVQGEEARRSPATTAPGGQAETPRSEPLVLDEPFANDPAGIMERLAAPSTGTGKHWTKQQKMALIAAGGVVFMLLLGAVLKVATKEKRPAATASGKAADQARLESASQIAGHRPDQPPSSVATIASPSPSPENPAAPPVGVPGNADGFVSLFDGKTLSGWEGDTSRYVVEDGKLVVDFGSQPFRGPGGDLFTANEYQDFILRLEYTVSAEANGGILLRAPVGAGCWRESLEVQILDDSAPTYRNLPPHNFNGSLFGVVAAEPGHVRPPGQWNTLEVQWKGRRVTETLNGVVVLDTDLDDPADKSPKGVNHPGLKRDRGRIILLGYASRGRLEFRNLQVKDLTSASKAAQESPIAEEGFASLFNGKTLDGWHINGVGQWSVEDEAIVGRISRSKGKNWAFGHLISNANYADFHLKLKFKLSGNSGVYLRGQEAGTDGAIGLQVELYTPQEIGGLTEILAYPSNPGIQVPNPQNRVQEYFRPDGWNDLDVTVLGGKVVCRVNGQQTAELSNYTTRQEGSVIFQLFGVCDTEVRFKDIRLRHLP